MRAFAIILVLLLVGTQAALANPFGPSSAPTSETLSWLPHFLLPFIAWLMPLQRDLIGMLQNQIDAIRAGAAPLATAAIVTTGFIYGVVHSAGPGHGKMVMGSYFATRKADVTHLFLASGGIALVQALSAVFLVWMFTAVLNLGTRWLLQNAGWFDVVSFGLIGCFGLLIAWRAARGVGCGHDHAHEPETQGHPPCDHHEHEPDHDHGHGHHAPAASARELLWGALVVGMRPCTGAILILLFTFSNGLYGVGILATVAMAVGTAATVGTISLGAVGIRSLGERFFTAIGMATTPRRALSMFGGLAIAVVGFLMMAATLGTVG